MTGSIDDVDLGAFVIDRNIFGQNSDPPLSFQHIAVQEGGLTHFILVISKDMRLLDESVDESGFAVINVSNNGDISDV